MSLPSLFLMELNKQEALHCAYGEAKEILKSISMFRSGVMSEDQLRRSLRESVAFLELCADELEAPRIRPFDNVGDLMAWMTRDRVVYNAVAQTIRAHGAITPNWIGSASKRIRGSMLSQINTYRRVAERIRRQNGFSSQGQDTPTDSA